MSQESVPVPPSLLAPLVQAAGELLKGVQAHEVPPGVRPLLGFDRRGFGSEAARRQLLRALETEDEFRDRVVEAFAARPEVETALGAWAPSDALEQVEAAAGRDDLPLLTSALYAARPEGWEFGVGLAVARLHHDLATKADEDERKLVDDRLRRVDEARRRAEGEVERLAAEVERLGEELRQERASRREREEAAEGAARAARLELEAVTGELEAVKAALERTEERLAREAQRAATLDEQAREARAALDAAEREAPPPAPPPLTAEEADVLEQAATIARRLAAQGPKAGGGAPRAQEQPAPAGRPGPAERPAPAERPGPAERPAPAERPGPAERPAPARLTRRVRVPVPPGMVGASVDGLRGALQANPAPVVVVDGYNVSMLAWGGDPPDAQRQRLCALLERLHVRWNVMITVVFDGADVEASRPPRRSGVRVVFSSADVEADEVVVQQIADLPLDVPAVAVSSDRWVQDHAEAQGALVVPSDVFLDLLRR